MSLDQCVRGGGMHLWRKWFSQKASENEQVILELLGKISTDSIMLRTSVRGQRLIGNVPKQVTFPACFSIPIIFSNFDFNCSNLSSLRNLQEQVKKAFCYQKFFWSFTVWINCTSDLKNFANCRPSASNFKSFSRSLECVSLTVGQSNFGNKISFLFHPSQ